MENESSDLVILASRFGFFFPFPPISSSLICAANTNLFHSSLNVVDFSKFSAMYVLEEVTMCCNQRSSQ
jgi:hypothetical protein